jgi:pimeloyl-ACP methyl ester carboxylesterase
MSKTTRVIGLGLASISLGVLVAGCVVLRPDIPYPMLEARYANPQSRFMDLPGGLRVHYRDQGDPMGPPVVMVHGFAASLEAWEPWVARLGDRYRIVTLDLPGHGLTRAPTDWRPSLTAYAAVVDAVTDRLNLPPFVLVGNSMGGGVAWTYALEHAGRLRALVLVDSIGLPAPASAERRTGTPLVFQILATPAGRFVLAHIDTRSLAEKGLRQAYVDQTLVTPALVDRYVDLSRAPGHRQILTSGSDRGSTAITSQTFTAIRVPTLVLHGQADSLIPVASSRALATAIPGATLITYPGVGHVPMEQIPDRSAADVRAFLARTEPANGEGVTRPGR